MVSFGTVAILVGGGLAIFFSKDIATALNNLKGFGSSFGQDFGKLPDININVPEFPEIPIPDFSTQAQQINQFGIDVQKNINDALANAQSQIDKSLQQSQKDFEQFGTDVNTNIAGIQKGFDEAGEASLVFGADIQEGITGNRNAIGDFFGNLFGTGAEKEIEKSDGAPVTTPTVTTPAQIDRQAGRRTFGGQTSPKMTLTKEEATTPTQSNVIISKQPDLTLVSPFLTSTPLKQIGFEDEPVSNPNPFSRRSSR